MKSKKMAMVEETAQEPALGNPFRAKSGVAGREQEAPEVAPLHLASDVDHFVAMKREIKDCESRLAVSQENILAHCLDVMGDRIAAGRSPSFRLQGNRSAVTFVSRQGAASLSQDDFSRFCMDFGELPAESLLALDYGGFKFDAEVLRENFDAVLAALRVLPPHVLDRLIVPAGYKPVPGAVVMAAEHVKEKSLLLRMLRALKISNFIAAA